MSDIVTGYRQFDKLFDRCVVDRLEPIGFRRSSRSLFLDNGLENVALLRIGGKIAGPGSAVMMLGLRHSFLTTINEPDRLGFVGNDLSYPFCFRPEFLQRTPSWLWRFRSYSRHKPWIFRYGGVVWENRPAGEVEQELHDLARLIEHRFLPWCHSMTPRRALRRIRWARGKQWRERQWIQDYRDHLAGSAGTG